MKNCIELIKNVTNAKIDGIISCLDQFISVYQTIEIEKEAYLRNRPPF